MRLISWNVNGLRAVQKKGFIEWLLKESPDVLCLQETKAEEAQLDEGLRHPPGYHSFWCSAEKKGYSGVGLYTKSTPVSVEYGIGKKEFDSEGRTIVADYGAFVLFNIYFPNGSRGNARVPFKMAFYDQFLKKAEALRKKGRHVIVCGDVNTAHAEIDLARPKENQKNTGFLPEERAWVSQFIGKGYADTFRHFCKDAGHYSWWDYKTAARSRDIGWRIDYFFVDRDFLPRVKAAFILKDVMGSDHCPVGIEICD
ncbi:MAG: exodeoxyribonuclease III [Candidatus Omnitrophica bacterium]|nr:exodeoxyribonuclease III [Candidatus Omnitrophota bacterium]